MQQQPLSASEAASLPSVPQAAQPQQQQQQQQQHVLRMYKQHQLTYRLQRLQQLAGQHAAQQPVWQNNYGYGVSSTATNNHAHLDSQAPSAAGTDARVQHLALKVPGLLSLHPGTLHSHVTELQLLLGLQADDPRLTRLVLLQPGLLTQAPRTLANKLQLLQHLTGQSEQYIIDMVLRCPAVLTLSPDNVSRKWGVLQDCVAACGTWQQQLAVAPPVSVGMMLCYSIQRLQRLQYVVQLSKQQQQAAQRPSSSRQAVHPSCSSTPDAGASQSRSSVSTAIAHSSSSSRSRSSRMRQGRRSPGVSVEQCVADLDSVPWRSLVQEAEAAFTGRFPGFKAWLQQQ
jgi:hypothetical protein